MLPSIITKSSVTVFIQGRPFSFDVSSEIYQPLVELLKAGDVRGSEILAMIEAKQKKLEHSFEKIGDTSVAISQDGIVRLNDQPVNSSLTRRMFEMRQEGFDLQPMARFLENLVQNPSYRAVQELYGFLEAGKMPITPDGCFLAYKAVRADFKDIHSGTYDNSVGRIISMPRNQVDEDSARTCSAGLHVCSFAYLPYFAHAQGHVMVCKINPRDVVAIPQDYNNTKMRVCQYEVVGEYADYYAEHPECGGLSQASVLRDIDDKPFRVEIWEDDEEDGDGGWLFYDGFNRLSEASACAEALVDNGGDPYTDAVRVVNVYTDEVLLELEA